MEIVKKFFCLDAYFCNPANTTISRTIKKFCRNFIGSRDVWFKFIQNRLKCCKFFWRKPNISYPSDSGKVLSLFNDIFYMTFIIWRTVDRSEEKYIFISWQTPRDGDYNILFHMIDFLFCSNNLYIKSMKAITT